MILYNQPHTDAHKMYWWCVLFLAYRD